MLSELWNKFRMYRPKGIETLRAHSAHEEPRKTVVVLGSEGNIGQVIVAGMKKLGYLVRGFDLFTDENQHAIRQLEPDAIISALPYFLNYNVALLADECKAHYCDLGGSVGTTQDITFIPFMTNCCLTDMGLAPGWINIETEYAIQKYIFNNEKEPESVTCYVGGLPQKDNQGPMHHKLNWSFDGLMNEYCDECEIVREGNIEEVEGMSGLENVAFHNQHFEAFHTSGASSHSIGFMLENGIENFAYKTLRWPGHCNLIKHLLNTPKIGTEAIEQALPRESFFDFVIMAVVIDGCTNYTRNHEFKNYSAMQNCTAYPVCAVVDMMLKDILPKRHLSYSDIVEYYDIFHETLKEFNL